MNEEMLRRMLLDLMVELASQVQDSMRGELQKMTTGVSDAIAIVIAVTAAASETTPATLMPALKDAAQRFRVEGNLYAAAVLEAACNRLEPAVLQ